MQKRLARTRVVRLNLVIGEFSSVVDDSIQFYWDMMAKDTIAAGAQLCFERVPGRMQCVTCQHEFLHSNFDGACPACGGARVLVVDGNQFRLDSIEIEGERKNGNHTED